MIEATKEEKVFREWLLIEEDLSDYIYKYTPGAVMTIARDKSWW